MAKRKVKKIRSNDYENMSKYDKQRHYRKSSQVGKSKELDEAFVLNEDEWNDKVSDDYFKARVVEVHKRYQFVSPENDDGEIDTRDVWLATVAKKFLQSTRKDRNFVTVGDIVLCKKSTEQLPQVSEDLPQCTIENLKERKSVISRLDPMTQERRHVLASNLDQLVIVASYLHPTVKWGLIDRYLVLAESEHLSATIILNKRDLLEDHEKKSFVEECDKYLNLYRDLGYEVLDFQANLDGDGKKNNLKKLVEVFSGKVSLVSGHSGVGKSSLVNLMKPEIKQDVESDSIFYKGRHTTTYASLIKLGTGGYVIDSPGIRSFAIEERSAVELSWCYVEMRPYIGKCKYRECRHVDEPECAVIEAVRSGEITEERYKSYIGILTGATGREGRMRDIKI